MFFLFFSVLIAFSYSCWYNSHKMHGPRLPPVLAGAAASVRADFSFQELFMFTQINNSKLYAVIDSVGAEVKGLRDLHGTEYIWPGDDTYWSYSSPVLFPIVGALRGGAYLYNGQQYHMRQHGICRDAAFQKVAGRTDAATFCLTANETTRAQYPFDFALFVEYALHDFTMAVKFRVENRGTTDMPFAIGAHPAIRVPLEAEESITDYRVKFSRRETVDYPALTADGLIDQSVRYPLLRDTDTLPLDHALFQKHALILEGLQSRTAELYSLESGRGVRLTFDGFDYFALWQPKTAGAPFVCLEPWTGTATQTHEDDSLEHKRGMRLLPPGETWETQYKLTVL